jgi:hypothetical protein
MCATLAISSATIAIETSLTRHLRVVRRGVQLPNFIGTAGRPAPAGAARGSYSHSDVLKKIQATTAPKASALMASHSLQTYHERILSEQFVLKTQQLST